jgi:NAD(P)-binding Rossmann-like domain
MLRRKLLKAGAYGLALPSLAALSSCKGPQPWDRFSVSVDYPGMLAGHLNRNTEFKLNDWSSAATESAQTVVIGSGLAGLMAAWQLQRNGHKNIVSLAGPELHGNAASLNIGATACPTGAHYLPLPSMESLDVREVLSAMNVLQGDAKALAPTYSENNLVHAPVERLLRNGVWENTIHPTKNLTELETRDDLRFRQVISEYSNAVGKDGKRAFVVPVALASKDPRWQDLDTINFKTWLARENFTSPSLLWHLDYCCRDEYGAGIDHVSAWAGLHYFCSRSGHASNADDGAVLTWPNGLGSIAQFLSAPFLQSSELRPLSAIRILRQRNGVQVFAQGGPDSDAAGKIKFNAQHVIVATPLQVARKIDPDIAAAFPTFREQLLPHYPWLVSNFEFTRTPDEAEGTELAWDNVVYGSQGLGFVNAMSQKISVEQSPAPVLTSYRALSAGEPIATRQWLAQALEKELLTLASDDLEAAYGDRFWRHLKSVRITVRGHGMPSPAPGFLSNPINLALKAERGRVQFAAAELSGYSVFEEAAWWGSEAARSILGK